MDKVINMLGQEDRTSQSDRNTHQQGLNQSEGQYGIITEEFSLPKSLKSVLLSNLRNNCTPFFYFTTNMVLVAYKRLFSTLSHDLL